MKKKQMLLATLVGLSALCAPSVASASSYPTKTYEIYVNGNYDRFDHAITYRGSAYFPLGTLLQSLDEYGIDSKWDGHHLYLTSWLQTADFRNIHPGTGDTSIYFNGHLMQRVNKFVYHQTTYLPIGPLTQVLNHLGISNSLHGTNWYMNGVLSYLPKSGTKQTYSVLSGSSYYPETYTYSTQTPHFTKDDPSWVKHLSGGRWVLEMPPSTESTWPTWYFQNKSELVSYDLTGARILLRFPVKEGDTWDVMPGSRWHVTATVTDVNSYWTWNHHTWPSSVEVRYDGGPDGTTYEVFEPLTGMLALYSDSMSTSPLQAFEGK